jgi:hypothetical protein
MGQALKRPCFGLRKRAALERQSLDRRWRQPSDIPWVNVAQKALGHDVQSHGFGDVLWKPARQPLSAGVLVPVVDVFELLSVGLAPADRREVRDVMEHVRGQADLLAEITMGALTDEELSQASIGDIIRLAYAGAPTWQRLSGPTCRAGQTCCRRGS